MPTKKTQSLIPLPVWVLVPLGIVFIPIFPFMLAYSASKKKFENWKENSPVRPLRRNRKRVLTLPLPKASYSGRKAQRTYDQLQSLFLNRLSFEIRLIIYEYVLAPPGDQLLHVAAISGRLCGIRCYESDPTRPAWEHKCWKPSDLAQSHPRHQEYLGLLCSCRQMSVYSESVNILYAKNTLSVRQTRAILAFPHVMLPHRLASISKMNIDLLIHGKLIDIFTYRQEWPEAFTQDWKCVCQVLSKMDTCGLQRLEIILNLCGGGRNQYGADWATDDGLASLLVPLMGIQVPEFSVILHDWPQRKEDVLRILRRAPPFSIELKKP